MTLTDVKNHINKAVSNNDATIKIGFATISQQAMHPQYGVPQLYHDQWNLIGQHLWDIKNSPEWQKEVNEEIILDIDQSKILRLNHHAKKHFKKNKQWSFLCDVPNWYKIRALKKTPRKLTRRYLLKQPDWDDWKSSEHKQLNQYESQGTFSEPCPLPDGANCLPLLWTYLIKDCGTKKARCVCNGSNKMKGSVTLRNTYAGALEQTGSRIFWAGQSIILWP
jgi:hypothetical protein